MFSATVVPQQLQGTLGCTGAVRKGQGLGQAVAKGKVGMAVVACEAAEGTRRALLCHWGSVRAQSLWH